MLTLSVLVLTAAPALCAVFDLELDEEEANFVPVSEFGLDEGGYIEVNITNVRSRSTLSYSHRIQVHRDAVLQIARRWTHWIQRPTWHRPRDCCGAKREQVSFILIMSHVLAAEMAGTSVRVQLLSGALAGCRPPAHEHDDWVRLTCIFVFFFS